MSHISIRLAMFFLFLVPVIATIKWHGNKFVPTIIGGICIIGMLGITGLSIIKEHIFIDVLIRITICLITIYFFYHTLKVQGNSILCTNKLLLISIPVLQIIYFLSVLIVNKVLRIENKMSYLIIYCILFEFMAFWAPYTEELLFREVLLKLILPVKINLKFLISLLFLIILHTLLHFDSNLEFFIARFCFFTLLYIIRIRFSSNNDFVICFSLHSIWNIICVIYSFVSSYSESVMFSVSK